MKNIVRNVDFKRNIKANIPYIIVAVIVWVMADSFTFIPFADWVVGIVAGLGMKIMVYVKGQNAKKWRKDIEYGSARWGTAKDIEPFVDEKMANNIILTQTEALTMNSRPKQAKYARNKNVLVIGGSGSGKTRFYVKPNIMQCESKDHPVSFVVTDPKGTILLEMGKFLEEQGYTIKVLNTIDFNKSHKYNPFAYIKEDEDILTLVSSLIANTNGEGSQKGEDFWVKSERLLYSALISWFWYECNIEDQNFGNLVDMINAMEIREDDETFENAVDIIFKELEEEKPEHSAVAFYKLYKLAAGKTAKSILISCGARLSSFNFKKVREIMSTDELELDKLGGYMIKKRKKKTGEIVNTIEKRKTAFFVIISDTNPTFNFIVSFMYSQLFNVLCYQADNVFGGRLPVHVRCLLDEFANIGIIPNFDKLIATIRSREISASVILQAQSQLKTIYKDNMDTIIGNMDTTLFLGGKEKTTLKDISESLGKETIDMFNTSKSMGNSPSHGQSFQKLGKELMSIDEISVMDGSKCILQVRGVRPFLSNKYDIEKHHNYKNLADYDSKNIYDINNLTGMSFSEKHIKIKKSAKVDVIVDGDSTVKNVS